MLTNRQLFIQHVAQTSNIPVMLEIERAYGMYMYDVNGKKYLDLISGISVSNLGHNHPAITKAVKKQVDNYMHLMVYGEFIESPQVKLASLLAQHLPDELNCTFFVNSGSEAIEGAMKLAKRYTGRSEIIAFENGYHGSTHGALSLSSDVKLKKPFEPLVQGIKLLKFNNINDLEQISDNTACVIIEPIQGEAGVIFPENGFLEKLRERCSQNGTLLVFDEIQTGFGRTGSLFSFEQYNVQPDILVLAKAMGGGMPLGGFISSKEMMACLSENPALGHITTFGGHPVSCAAGLASLETLVEGNLIQLIKDKELLFLNLLKHPAIKSIRSKGLFFAVEMENSEINLQLITSIIEKGVFIDWFLYATNCFRIAPPLIISDEEIKTACKTILSCMDRISS